MNLVECWNIYLLVANSVDVIAGDFTNDLSKVSSNELLDHMIGYTQVVNEPTHISGSQINHVYIKSASLKSFIHCSKMFF